MSNPVGMDIQREAGQWVLYIDESPAHRSECLEEIKSIVRKIRIKAHRKYMEKKVVISGSYAYNVYFISEELGWGYRISDKQNDETWLRNYGFETMETAKAAAIKQIKIMENEECQSSESTVY